ncbi:hypothetical protein D3C83_335450 [compost metagenome]
MLQRVEAKRGERRRILMAEDAEDAALFVKLVVVRVERAFRVSHLSSLSDRPTAPG